MQRFNNLIIMPQLVCAAATMSW